MNRHERRARKKNFVGIDLPCECGGRVQVSEDGEDTRHTIPPCSAWIAVGSLVEMTEYIRRQRLRLEAGTT